MGMKTLPKTFWFGVACGLALVALIAAVPALTDFNTTQFDTSNNKVALKSGVRMTNAYSANSFTANYAEFTNNVQIDGSLTIPTGATNGFVFTTDGSGTGSWRPGGLTGTGTAGAIPYFLTSSTLGSSPLTTNSNGLTLAGTLRLSDGSLGNAAYGFAATTGTVGMYKPAVDTLAFQIASLQRLAITPDKVSITPVGGGLEISGGTNPGDSSLSLFNASGAWNNAGATLAGIKLNITDTASTTSSLLLDLEVGSATKMGVRKGGGVLQPWTTLTMTGSNVSTVDFSAGSVFSLTATNDAYFGAPANLPGTGFNQTAQIYVKQDATGGRAVTLTNLWNVSGTVKTNANSVSVITVSTSPFDATNVYTVIQQF